MRLCIYEDSGSANLAPLTLTRPAFDLRCGAQTLRQRQEQALGSPAGGVLVRPVLADLVRQQNPALKVNDESWLQTGPVVLVNARWLPGAAPTLSGSPEVGLVGDQVAYVVLPASEVRDLTPHHLAWRVAEWTQQLPCREAGGRLIHYPWDLIERNGGALEQDYESWRGQRDWASTDGINLVGPRERLLVDPSARIEPLALIDTTRGPVILDRGVVVQAFSRIEGPCYIGPQTQVMAARIRNSSIGMQCRVGGEVECSLMHGYSNKAHDGFLGHSYLGEWVNFGAGTTTSDLRTDYGPISMRLNGQKVDTGLIKVGSFVGDHTKTSIGVLLNTGSLIGPFGLLLTHGALMPRVLPSFCQVAGGQIRERSDLRELFTTAATMMSRRGQQWTEMYAEFFFSLFEQTAGERVKMIRDTEQRRLRRVV
jgi:UDP-N-acetylglucosamine diphosphorylase/glucosamine-1-phosphate N-acetyltransferase